MNLCRTPPSLKYVSGAPGSRCVIVFYVPYILPLLYRIYYRYCVVIVLYVPYSFGSKPILAISHDPKLSTRRISLTKNKS